MNVSVIFHKSGAISIDHIRYGPSTELAGFFVYWKNKIKRDKRIYKSLNSGCLGDLVKTLEDEK